MESFLTAVFPWIIFGLMVLSVLVSIVPIFPGGVVVWLLALLYGVVHPAHFDTLGWTIFSLITLLMIASALSDNVLMGTKARQAGASWRGIIMALIGGVISSIFITPLGGLVVASLTLYIHEYLRLKDSDTAYTITKGLVLGCGWAAVVRFGIAAVQLSLWSFWAWQNT
jgi:uncharacterized protein YqgC (DUF456 family)